MYIITAEDKQSNIKAYLHAKDRLLIAFCDDLKIYKTVQRAKNKLYQLRQQTDKYLFNIETV